MSDLRPESINNHQWESVREKLVWFFSHRNLPDAEDLAQETLARMMTWMRDGYQNQIEGKDGFLKIAYAFARNISLEARHRIKQEAHYRKPEADKQLPEDVPAPRNKTFGLDSPEASLLLGQLLQQLSQKDRALILAYHAKPHDETAKEMGMSVATFRVRVHRVRQKLNALNNMGEFGLRAATHRPER